MWSYVDLAGIRTDLTSTTDASTGVSTIQVYTTQPGYYSCEVTENGGSSRTYTAVMTDTNPDTGNKRKVCLTGDEHLFPIQILPDSLQ